MILNHLITSDLYDLQFGAWDLKSFLTNSMAYLKAVGGIVVSLVGLAVVLWVIIKISSKIAGSQGSQQHSWGTLIAGFVFGALCMVGGISLLVSLAGGAHDTFIEIGNDGAVLLPLLQGL